MFRRRLAVLLAAAMVMTTPAAVYAEEATEAVETEAAESEFCEAEVPDGEVRQLGDDLFETKEEDINPQWQTSVSWRRENGNAYIVKFSGTRVDVAIPPLFMDNDGNVFWVVGLDRESYINQLSINSIQMPNCIATIGEGVFAGCSNLKKINISERVSAIPDRAFENCDSLEEIFIPAAVKTIGNGAFKKSGLSKVNDVYFGGSESDWKAVQKGSNNTALEGANIHYNSKTWYSGPNYGPAPTNPNPNPNPTPGTPSDNSPSDNSASGNQPQSRTVSIGSAVITYNAEIAFPGKKLKAENFGITISANGQTFTAAKAKINKKTKKIQISKISPTDKTLQKELKKLTKGSSGLDFTIKAYVVSNSDQVAAKTNKNGEVKSVSIQLSGKKYKCRKDEFSYDAASKTITFKGENLAGTYTIH